MAKPKQKAAKIKKKYWYSIVAPPLFNNAVLGETYLYSSDMMMGKRVQQNLSMLTSDVRRQSVNLTFEVDKVQDDKGVTRIVGYDMIPASVKRMVRRRSVKIDLSLACETNDNKKVRIKPLLLTTSYTTGVVKNRIRRTVIAMLMNQVKGMTYDALMNDLISHKFQNEMRAKIKKIYPLRTCEIRSVSVLPQDKKKMEAKETEVQEPSKEATPEQKE